MTESSESESENSEDRFTDSDYGDSVVQELEEVW